MNDLRLEEHTLKKNNSMSKAVVEDMISRVSFGRVVIVADKPKSLLPAIRKEWKRQLRRRQNWLASTFDSSKIAQYTEEIGLMQTRSFTTKSPEEFLWANIYLCSPNTLNAFAPSCHTMYVTTELEKETLYRITAFMPDTGLVAVYRRGG